MTTLQALLPIPARAWMARFRLILAQPQWGRRGAALETVLEDMADRLARAEVALMREQRALHQARARVAEVETALLRLQAERGGA